MSEINFRNMERILDKDIEYINRMRAEIAEAENTPNNIEPLRRHSAPELVLIARVHVADQGKRKRAEIDAADVEHVQRQDRLRQRSRQHNGRYGN
jgi:hypothetical protein